MSGIDFFKKVSVIMMVSIFSELRSLARRLVALRFVLLTFLSDLTLKTASVGRGSTFESTTTLGPGPGLGCSVVSLAVEVSQSVDGWGPSPQLVCLIILFISNLSEVQVLLKAL